MEDNPLRAFAPLRILIVDDDPLIGEITTDHYADLGFSVDLAADGKLALQAMDKCRPDIVLCDRVMPEMSGAELLETVRKRGPDWQEMIFVFVSGLTERRDRYAMLPLRPDGYLFKPINFQDADRKLAAILADRRTPAAAEPS